MHNPDLLVGEQSEGPSHPLLMRKAPPRKHSTNLLSDFENISHPHTMFHQPKIEIEDEVQIEELIRPHDADHRSGPSALGLAVASYREQPYEREYYYDKYQEQSSPPVLAAEYRLNDPSSRDMTMDDAETENERRSRPRRVESSSHVESDIIERHGRFENFLGEKSGNQHNDVERFDTFGHDILEQTWFGPKR